MTVTKRTKRTEAERQATKVGAKRTPGGSTTAAETAASGTAHPAQPAEKTTGLPDVGTNLHLLRQERGLTLQELSERSGVSKAMLNQIEGGKSSPSIALGWKIANGLGVPFGALLGEAMPGDFVVHPRDQIQALYSENKELCTRALFPPGDSRAAELYELSLEPGGEEKAQSHLPGTREQIYVTAGHLTVQTGDSVAELQAGDVLFFCADRPHRYYNPGRGQTRFILAMLYPQARRTRES